ncbi:hypothetical protein AB0L35_36750 [Streptomyces sp. NPDC052309]|uniref:hypothetical protein n=1 Tax=Streptomyces sp. NPDC052309 TaxID=3155421 RepID=UPI003415583E
MSGPHHTAEPPPGVREAATRPRDGGTEPVRRAAFGCLPVPAVLLRYGIPPARAAGTALGLAAVTGVCVALPRRSERVAAHPPAGDGAPRPGRGLRVGPGACGGARRTGENTPVG